MRCVYWEFKKKMLFIKVMGKEIIDFNFFYVYNKRYKIWGSYNFGYFFWFKLLWYCVGLKKNF